MFLRWEAVQLGLQAPEHGERVDELSEQAPEVCPASAGGQAAASGEWRVGWALHQAPSRVSAPVP